MVCLTCPGNYDWMRQDAATSLCCCLVPSCFNLKGNSGHLSIPHTSPAWLSSLVPDHFHCPHVYSLRLPLSPARVFCPIVHSSKPLSHVTTGSVHAAILRFPLIWLVFYGLLVPSSMWSDSYCRLLQPVCFLIWLRSSFISFNKANHCC